MNTDISILLSILGITVFFLIFEFIRIDVVAMACLLSLGWTGLLDPGELFSGFSSNAVIVMMAVMVLGRGIGKAGFMDRFSRFILDKAGNDKTKIITSMMLVVGILSGFIQNIGAIALFLPGLLTISRRSKIPSSDLIMPIGFAAILGGTLTMVGSGPLVLVNDLLINAELEPYGMFSVTPSGALLLLSGLGYFLLFGKRVLPQRETDRTLESDQEKLTEKLHLPNHIWFLMIEKSSPLAGKTAEESGIWKKPSIHILAMLRGGELEYSPWRKTVFKAGQEIAILGSEEDVKDFAAKNKLKEPVHTAKFNDLLDPQKSGFAELFIPNRSELSGKTIREYSIRKRFGVEPVLLFSQGEEIRGDISDQRVKAGDTIIVYGLWDRIKELKESIDFVVTSSIETKKRDRARSWCALVCFSISVGLALSGAPVSLAYFSGAIAMVLTRTLSIEEMYHSIEWKVVFLLAGLIPLGLAMQKTGTAAFLAEHVISFMLGKHPIITLITVGMLATVFSLFISNSGAIVVLTPVLIEIAKIGSFDPRPLVLMAAVCAANSFIIPTHQVNAFLISPGGYRNADYFRAGIWMTFIFLAITVSYFYFVHL